MAFLLYERYTDEDALQARRRTPHFGDIIERQVTPLLEERAWTRVEPLPAQPHRTRLRQGPTPGEVRKTEADADRLANPASHDCRALCG